MLGTVKIYIGGNLNWVISLLLLISAVCFALTTTPLTRRLASLIVLVKPYKPMLLGWMLFMTGIAISGALHNGTGLYTIAKYVVILLVLLLLLLLGTTSAQLEKALTLALVVSVIPLIFFIVFRFNNAMVILGDGRMGWLAIWPGVLWKAGAYMWPCALWHHVKRPTWTTAGLAALSMLAMALDGSRTSVLWLGVTWAALAACGVWLKVPGRGLRAHAGLMVLAALLFTLAQPVMLTWVEGRYDTQIVSSIEKVKSFSFSFRANPTPQAGAATTPATIQSPADVIASIENSARSSRLVKGNVTTRQFMLQDGWRQALAQFPWGCGFGCTTIEENGERTVIHMTYLQILGDEGIIALAGYMLFMLFPLYRAIQYLVERPAVLAERFDLMLAPVSILSLYLLTGFLHPLSNELTEWALVVGAIASVMIHVKRSD